MGAMPPPPTPPSHNYATAFTDSGLVALEIVTESFRICVVKSGSDRRTLTFAKVGIPYNDFKNKINQYILSTWQDDWNGVVANKLHSVKPVLGD